MNRRYPSGLLLSLVLVTIAQAAKASDAANGKAIYEARCGFCHGMSGKGDGIAGASLSPKPSNFTSADYWKNATRENMLAAIQEGKPGTAMVGFKATLKPGEAEDLLAYIESFKEPPLK